MEKIMINHDCDITFAINFFGKKYSSQIKKITKEFPCYLIGSYSDDIEIGSGYAFCSVKLSDFKEENRLKIILECD